MATMKALEAQRDSLMTALNKAVEEHREAIDARDDRIEALEDERDGAKRNAATLQAALDDLAAVELRTRLRLDAMIYAMVLMQHETRALREARVRDGKGNVWDGKNWVALAT